MDLPRRHRRATYEGRRLYKQRRLNPNQGQFTGRNFILAGIPPPPLTRADICARIIALGGNISSAATPQITHALIGQNASARKLELIRRLNIQTMHYDDILDILQ